MRILHVVPDLSPLTGGPVTAVISLAQAQAALGINTTIATTNHGLDNIPEIPGVSVRAFPCRWSRWRWSPALTGFLEDHVGEYDIVSIDSLWMHTNLAAWKICRRAGVPYIVNTNGMLERWSLAQKSWKKRPYLRWVERSGLRSAAALRATSEMEAVGSSMSSWNSSVFVLPIGIPCACASPPEPLAFPALIDRQIILTVGRVHYVKQPDVVIRAFHLISQRHPEAALVFVGPYRDSYMRPLQRLVSEFGLGGRVFFTGFFQQEFVRAACRAASVFVLPSLQESFGVAIAEAMAEGCPVVVSDRVGIALAIDRAGAGLVTSPTAEATAAAVSMLLKDEFMRARMGKNAPKLVHNEFAVNRVAAQSLEIYEDILRGTHDNSAWLSCRPAQQSTPFELLTRKCG